jgi:16S rRNA (guanine527-N7)-methyltransferase
MKYDAARAYREIGAPNGLPPEGEPAFVAWYDLLAQWNRKINLTRVSKPAAAVAFHWLDSLPLAQAAPRDATLLDIGAGAGAPGLVVAALRPDVQVTVSESSGKKAGFLVQAVHAMKLANVRVESVRAETLTDRFAVVTARAVAEPKIILEKFGHLLRPGGVIALFLAGGVEPELTADFVLAKKIDYALPLDYGRRRLAIVARVGKTTMKIAAALAEGSPT